MFHLAPVSPSDSGRALSPQQRHHDALSGVWIELVSSGWMVIEAIVAIAGGVIAHSVLLTAFGVDSVLELVTGATLLWRLHIEARGGSVIRVERAENLAAWVTSIGLILLCVYIVVFEVGDLLAGTHAEKSVAGVVIALIAVLLMPLLAWRKRVVARRLGSAALRSDAACSIVCAYMAATLLAGLSLNVLFGWWWADAAMALVLLIWLVPEAREALEGARAGRASCGCSDD